MTPTEALAARLHEKCYTTRLEAQGFADEALRWMEERMPGRETIRHLLRDAACVHCTPQMGPCYNCVIDALLADLRERFAG